MTTETIQPNGRNFAYGAEAFGAEIGKPKRKAFHLLESGAVRTDVAVKVGGQWITDIDKLRSLPLCDLFVKPVKKSKPATKRPYIRRKLPTAAPAAEAVHPAE